MPIEILMPALSPTMTEGNLAKWIKKEGDKIKAGQVIAEIETDKATMEVEAVDEGVLGKILVAEGAQGVKVNEVIALMLAEGEDKKALDSYKPKAAEKKEEPKKEAAPQTAAAPAAAPAPSLPSAPSFAPPPPVSMPAPSFQQGGKVFASPLAKRIAAEAGIPVGMIQGTGPHGRVVRADVEKAKSSGGGARGFVVRNPQEYVTLPNNNMRKVIARRLTESKQFVPHFYLTVSVELDKLLEVRKELNTEAEVLAGKEGKPAYKLSVNDLIIKATALALKRIPGANAMWTDEAIYRFNNVDISVAVATDGGLITPIVRNADQKSAMQISSEMKDLAARARAGKLKPEEFQGGGFSISNLGMYGVKHFAAIINPPQGCILAVGAGEERVVVKKGQMVVANVMDATLSVDHRVVDGALGAEFLAAFKRYVESPSLLLL
ncbi:MAG TPA: pyruvate dehydrogenase complex dihydrolipoamide acetyltransferase [Rickettsiales bacterium]|nr:pyruvate dehydrogenase complex dihydrolipoamide acetyltransferase [Rickettsiales bacterium]